MPSGDETIAAAVKAILDAADRDIAARKPVCVASGKCCKFEEYGHRLYVTAAEMLHFAAVMGRDARAGAAMRLEREAAPTTGSTVDRPGLRLPLPLYQADGALSPGCVYQVSGMCTAREARPLGCRVYFCDANAQSWQSELYEKYHGQLRELHETHGLPYAYREWREALGMLGADGGP